MVYKSVDFQNIPRLKTCYELVMVLGSTLKMRICIGFCTLWLAWPTVTSANAVEYKVICYYTNWSPYRPGSGQFDISDINTSLCTHLIYAYVGITADGDISVSDASEDLADNDGADGFGRFVALKEDNEDLKTLVSIGGWTEGSTNFSAVVNDKNLRATFVSNAVNFLNCYGFDGLDVDWEYPNQRDGVETDVQNFVLLLKALREAFESYGFILTVAAGASLRTTKTSYDVPGVAANVDYINLITYAYHSSANNLTGHNAPLYAAKRETTAAERAVNINASINYWLEQGAPASKLILGTTAYGKTFTLTNSLLHVPGSPASGPGVAGHYTGEIGTLAYFEICSNILNNGWTEVFDEEQRVPYAYSGDQWVSFDNAVSMTEKANYIKSMGLAGATLWAFDKDDFSGAFCGVKYPLLTTLYNELK